MSMFTSLHPTVHGVYLDKNAPYRLDKKIKTLAQYFEGEGYANAAFTGGGNVAKSYGFDQGFGENYTIDNYWRQAFKWIDENHKKRFFLFLHTYLVHDPYQPPRPYDSMFADPKYSGKIKPAEGKSWDERHRAYWDLVDKNDPEDINQLIALYDGGIRCMDIELMSPLLERFHQYGLMKKTIIVFLSDHGEEFMEHGGFLHEKIYDETIHVPLLIYLPKGMSCGLRQHRVDAQIPLIDIMPTLLDLMEIDYDKKTIQGKSLRPYLESRRQIDRPVYSARLNPRGAAPAEVFLESIRYEGYKLIQILYKPTINHELYNVNKDELESHDLAKTNKSDVEAYANTLKQITVQNQEMRTSLGIRPESTTLDSETVEQLKALGYLE